MSATNEKSHPDKLPLGVRVFYWGIAIFIALRGFVALSDMIEEKNGGQVEYYGDGL